MEVVDLILQYKTHSKHTLFAVSNLRKQKLILFSDILGSVNIIWKSTGKLEKSRCLIVHLAAALVAEKMPGKSGLPIKLISIGKRPVPVVQYLNSIMILMTLMTLMMKWNA